MLQMAPGAECEVDVVDHEARESFSSCHCDLADCTDPEEEVLPVELEVVEGNHLLVLVILTRSWTHS